MNVKCLSCGHRATVPDSAATVTEPSGLFRRGEREVVRRFCSGDCKTDRKHEVVQ